MMPGVELPGLDGKCFCNLLIIEEFMDFAPAGTSQVVIVSAGVHWEIVDRVGINHIQKR